MSGITNLPEGGKKFKSSNFSSKLKHISKYDREIAALLDNQQTLIDVINNYQYSIRSGSFNKYQQDSALSQMKRNAKFSSGQLKTVKKILTHLTDSGVTEKTANKIRIVRAGDEDLGSTGLAGISSPMRGAGLSNISSPHEEYQSVIKRPLVSIHQLKRDNSISSDPLLEPKTPQRPPIIPLSR